MSPVKESSFLQRETSVDEAESVGNVGGEGEGVGGEGKAVPSRWQS